jgi:hypothetical protein
VVDHTMEVTVIIPIRQWHRIVAPDATEFTLSNFPPAIGASDAELLHLAHVEERALLRACWERLVVICGPRLPQGAKRSGRSEIGATSRPGKWPGESRSPRRGGSPRPGTSCWAALPGARSERCGMPADAVAVQ